MNLRQAAMTRRRKTRMKKQNKSGQGMVEYIIIVAIIALAAIAIFGVFGDTIRAKLGGAVTELGGSDSDKDAALTTKSADYLKDLGTSTTTP
jgi:Flp pilus assembly pilin Flp